MRRGFRTHRHELAAALLGLMESGASPGLEDREFGEAVCALALERGADAAAAAALSVLRTQTARMDMATRHGTMVVMAALRVATPTAGLVTTIADYMSMFFPELDEMIERVRGEVQDGDRATFPSLANELADEVGQLYGDEEWTRWARGLHDFHVTDTR